MTSDSDDDYDPSSKTYVCLDDGATEDQFWNTNTDDALDLLKQKLESPRIGNPDELWYNGFEDLELRKLERSLFAIRVVANDIYRHREQLELWRIHHRDLKDILLEVDSIDMALRAPQLKQEFDFIVVEIKAKALPGFYTRKKPPGANIQSNQSMTSHAPSVNKKNDQPEMPIDSMLFDTRKAFQVGKNNDQTEIPIVRDMHMPYALIEPPGITRETPQSVKYEEAYYDFSSPSKVEGVSRKLKDTESIYESDNSAIYAEESLSASSKGIFTSTKIGSIDILPKEGFKRKQKDSERIYSKSDPDLAIPDESIKFTNIDSLPQHLKKCLLYTSLFPKKFEFKKDMLVQMWIAAGYVRGQREKLLEETAGVYFEELLSMSLFQVSILDETRYILQDDVCKLLHECAPVEYERLEDGNLNGISKRTLHSSILCERNFDPMIFKSFHKLKGLHSLLLLHNNGKHINQIPYNLITSLGSVRVFDLSGTNIEELPSSIGNMKSLLYLDLSGTPIKSLPQSICNLSGLQTLKLRGCTSIVELPINMKNMINLRHLELDIIRQLTFMPPRLGRLTNLQTLSAFIAGKRRGSQIAELKDMNNLQGSLSIVKLENVLSEEDAQEAAIYNKEYLGKINMQWSLACLEAMKVLDALQPHWNVKELEIIRYGGHKFPTWLGDSRFSKLTSVYIYNCKNCTLLPLLGRLPSLTSLLIGEMHALTKVDHHFFGGKNTKMFSKLETLAFDGIPCLEEWTGIEENGMPCLRRLTIVDCPNLVKLFELSNLKTLQHLEISLCFKLLSLAEKMLPASLETLIITDCPKLKEGCQEKGVDRHKIAGVPAIWIDYQQIFLQEAPMEYDP